MCWESEMGHHETGTNSMGQLIWSYSVRSGGNHFTKGRNISTETVCHMRGPCFMKVKRCYKLLIGVINNLVFGVTSNTVKDMLMGRDTEWKREGNYSENGCIMFVDSSSDRFLRRTNLVKSNAETLGGDKDEQGKLPYHGDFVGTV